MDPLKDGFLDRYHRDKQGDFSDLNTLPISDPLHPLGLVSIPSQILEPPRIPNSTFLRTFMSRSTLLAIASPIVSQTCYLAELSKEIFGIILGHLPSSSASSLALTCKGFLAAVGNDPFEALSRDRYETYVLLWFIAKDLPHQSVCHSCNRLHNNEAALKCYRDGRNACGESQKRHKAQKCRLDTRLDWGYKELLDEDFHPRIFNMAIVGFSGDPLFIVHGWFGSHTPTINRTLFGLTMEQCAHTRVCYMNGIVCTRSYGLSHDDDDADSQSLLFDWDSPEITFKLLKCRRCSTQCQLTVKPLPVEGLGMAIYITRWVDLGYGTLDEKWQRYFQRGRFEFEYQQQPDSLFLSSVFENDGGFRSKIEDQRYASLFHSPVPEN
ncbi:hypothetical protein BHYA_0331g00120 [Botrytis hyacinthi]|uniref:Uncharacterized protein n=1 Tax=Botrytis hyacinthi TaxID=278943 RepID=A0A4Z1G5L9_9HELO|nr:hypothetical protein BHYA_0331g00120 [Botrytis hyacinthi]